MRPELLRLGINPAGPGPSFQVDDLREPTLRWTSLWAWTQRGAVDVTSSLTDRARALKDRIGAELERQVARTVFASGRRDAESIGVGFSSSASVAATFAPDGMSAEVFEQVACSFVRLMGRRRRLLSFQEVEQRAWPANVRSFIETVALAQLGSVNRKDEVFRALERALGTEARPASGWTTRMSG